jgi:hypothetical protein
MNEQLEYKAALHGRRTIRSFKYRSISLLMAGYKIYTRVITERLSAIIDTIISDSQKWLQKRMITH